MKTLLTVLSVATGVLAVVGVQQYRQIRTLTDANAALTQQAAQAASPAAAPPPADGPGKLSEGLLTELLQLRAEVGRLRKQAAGVAPAQVAQLQEKVATQSAQLEAASAEAKFRSQLILRVNALKILGLAARIYATEHQDLFPTTFEAMRGEMNLDANGNFSGGISPDEFEFYPQPRPATEAEPQLILFREKRPLTGPNGQEVRVFSLADGSVQQVTADRLAQFEREGTATGPAPQ